MRSVLCGAALGLPLAIGGVPAVAQTDPAARALIQQLLPRASSVETRGIRPAGSSSPAAVSPAPVAEPAPVAAPVPAAPQAAPRQAAAAAPEPRRTTTAPAGVGAASLVVTFPSGSAELTPAAMATLTPLGQALASQDLSSFRFRIEGHTDSVGAREQNQSLSERRAAAVREFLVQRFGIDASRLATVGKGEDDLLIPTGDEVAEPRNRRVQIVNIGG